MRVAPAEAELVINGQPVGHVLVKGQDVAWGYGEFRPEAHFSQFAPLFGTWSLLMHSDDSEPELTPDAAAELRDIELALDHLHAELHWMHDHSITPVTQLNIDGPLIEWKCGT